MWPTRTLALTIQDTHQGKSFPKLTQGSVSAAKDKEDRFPSGLSEVPSSIRISRDQNSTKAGLTVHVCFINGAV